MKWKELILKLTVGAIILVGLLYREGNLAFNPQCIVLVGVYLALSGYHIHRYRRYKRQRNQSI